MMPQPDRRRSFGILLAALLALGLIAFAVINVLRWHRGGPSKETGIAIVPIALSEAPADVQEAAAVLKTSRVGYAMPKGKTTYLIISTGQSGEAIKLVGAMSEEGNAGPIGVHLQTSTYGQQMVVARMDMAVADTRAIYFYLDGQMAAIPAVVNAHGLPLTAFPDKAQIVVVSPLAGERMAGNMVQVTGYARVFEAGFQVQVIAAGKGRVIGEAVGYAAAGAPNWGSFRVTVPVNAAGVTEAIVVLHESQSGAKAAVPIKFGSK